ADLEGRGLQRTPRSRISELRLRGIDPAQRGGRTLAHQHFGESAIAAADIEPAQAFWRIEPGEKLDCDKLAPAAHEPLIGRAIGDLPAMNAAKLTEAVPRQQASAAARSTDIARPPPEAHCCAQ